jgi:hypothetical protein
LIIPLGNCILEDCRFYISDSTTLAVQLTRVSC